MFLEKGVLKIWRKFTGENPCRSALQLYLNHTSTWVLSCKFAVYFQNTFSQEHFWMAASVCCWNRVRCNGWGASSNCWTTEQSSVRNSRFHKAFLKEQAYKVAVDLNVSGQNLFWVESSTQHLLRISGSTISPLQTFSCEFCEMFQNNFFFNPLMPGTTERSYIPLHKKKSFSLKISSVNVNKSAVSFGFNHIY